MAIDDFEAEHDLAVLVEAQKVQHDAARMARAKRFAEEKADSLKDVAGKVFGKTATKGKFNGAVRGSKLQK